MLQRFQQNLDRHGLIAPHATVLCAVSGGADSVALLLLLHRLSMTVSFALHAAHLDHGLRAESPDDADFVATLCERLSVPLAREAVDVRALAGERREGLEAAGRFARRRFLEQVAADLGGACIALAHHADDQAETILFRLLRGTGVGGLAGMLPKNGPYIRPLLVFSRAELRDWLVTQGETWREDISNADPAYARNRIRHQILPELQLFSPDLPAALCRLGAQVALEEQDWQQRVQGVLDVHCRVTGDGLSLPIPALLALTPALRRRVLRELLVRVRGDLLHIEAVHVDRLDALLIAARPQAQLDLPGVWAARRYERLLLAAQPPVCPAFCLEVAAPGSYPLPTGAVLRIEAVGAGSQEDSAASVYFDAAAITFPLTVRSMRPGDRFQPSGMTGHKQLKDYFIDARIEVEARRRTPLVFAGERLLWVAGLRRCEGLWPRTGQLRLKMSLETPKVGDERLFAP